MKPCRSIWMLLACLAGAVSAEVSAAPACVASSGVQRAVLLELYTSEGCDSCPPADRRLSQFKGQPELSGRVVPLAFHVDYWDRLGWADRFASPQYTQRQYAMASLARSRLVYTPQFLKNGRDWRGAGSPLDGVGENPAGAKITLEIGVPAAGPVEIGGVVSGAKGTAETYVALYENNLESQVRAGENSGKTLRHDYVVRRLIGPLAPDSEGRVALRRQIALDPAWKRADLGVAVFVQDQGTGEILQALQRHGC